MKFIAMIRIAIRLLFRSRQFKANGFQRHNEPPLVRFYGIELISYDEECALIRVKYVTKLCL